MKRSFPFDAGTLDLAFRLRVLRRRHRSALASAFSAVSLVSTVTLSSLAAGAEARRLSVDDVVRMAFESHPRLAAARARADGARDMERSARGRLLPTIMLSEEYQHYDSPFSVAFQLPGQSLPPALAREQNTSTFVASASQPVLGLLGRLEDRAAREAQADAAQAATRSTEAAAREAIEVGYLRMFAAKRQVEIAEASEAELAEQVNVTAAQVKAGTLTQADLLRVQVARANARQQAIVAQTDVGVSRAMLLGAIGLAPDDATVEFVEPTSLLGRSPTTPAVEDSAAVLARRPDIAQARSMAEAAHHEAKSRLYAMLPDVDLEAAYVRVDGQVFAPKNAAFVGVKASWPIWEWGTQWNARRAAEAGSVAAEADLEAVRRDVLVDVVARRTELGSAASAVDLAEQTLANAKEAYRVTDAQARAGAATVTDVLDAQAALTQARLSLTRSRYEQAIARVRLERTTGTAPSAAPARAASTR